MLKNMKEVLISVFVVFLFCKIGCAQQLINFYDSKTNQNKPFLISKVSRHNEDGGEQLFHTIEQAYMAFMDDSEVALAFRVCSPLPLPVVFTSDWYKTSYTAYLIKERFSSETGGIKLDRVFLLRNDKNCAYNEKHKITEYWLVPKDSDFPEFVEIGKLTDFRGHLAEESGKYERKILIDSFKADEKFVSSENSNKLLSLTPSNYWMFKSNLLSLLRKDKFSFVLIEYPTHGKTRKTIFTQAVRLKQFLIENNIREGRIMMKPCGLSECEFDFENEYPIYPNVTSVYQN